MYFQKVRHPKDPLLARLTCSVSGYKSTHGKRRNTLSSVTIDRKMHKNDELQQKKIATSSIFSKVVCGFPFRIKDRRSVTISHHKFS